MGEKADKEKAEKKKAEKEKAEKEKAEKEKAEKENTNQKNVESIEETEAKGDEAPKRKPLAVLGDSDDDFPAPVAADDSDKEDAEESKSMEEELKQKLREKEAEKREAKSKEEHEKKSGEEKDVVKSKKTALGSLSDSDDDLPPPVSSALSDSDSGKKSSKNDKSGRPRSGDESDEHQSKKLKKDHKSKHKHKDKEERRKDRFGTREAEELKAILEAAKAPVEYGGIKNRFDPDRRSTREIREEKKKKKKAIDSDDDLPEPVSSNKEAEKAPTVAESP